MKLLVGDCVAVMASLPENSVAAIVTDPPYDLISGSRRGSARQPGPGPFGRHAEGNVGGFMGKHWDGTGVAFDPRYVDRGAEGRPSRWSPPSVRGHAHPSSADGRH